MPSTTGLRVPGLIVQGYPENSPDASHGPKRRGRGNPRAQEEENREHSPDLPGHIGNVLLPHAVGLRGTHCEGGGDAGLEEGDQAEGDQVLMPLAWTPKGARQKLPSSANASFPHGRLEGGTSSNSPSTISPGENLPSSVTFGSIVGCGTPSPG